MIKTPVKRTDGCLHMKHWHIRDADGMVKLTCSSKEDADQIVAALNAQPKIKVFKCRHFRGYSQPVPVPFGPGNCSEELGDCAIESESENCTLECPDYEEIPNAQQPECEKCEGSGTQKYTVDVYGDDNLPMSRPCPKCRPKAQREVKPKSKQEGD